jgi:metallophosphoesterase (TIGR00282 family)
MSSFFNAKDPFISKDSFENALRPYNFDKDCPGIGTKVFTAPNGVKIRVSNLIGRVFINLAQTNPFYDLDTLIGLDPEPLIHIVDFHAEATAEKRCLAEYADGRVTAVIGTHTHVQTNDAKLLDKGTLFLTDSGMNGAYDSVLGDEKEGSLRRTMTGMPADLTVPRKGKILVNALLFDVDEKTQKALNFALINETMEDDPS